MIQANELRLGNLVYSKGEIFEIITIGQFGVQLKNKTILVNAKFSVPDIEPIPLTEEWLQKIGFENNYKSSFTIKYEHPNKVFIEAIKRFGGEWFIRIHSYPIKHIKSVHQLQNLYFSLTGEELKINK